MNSLRLPGMATARDGALFRLLASPRRAIMVSLTMLASRWGHGWDEIDVEEKGGVYALEIAGNSLWPVYRDGDRLIVQPIAEPRQGDRVIAKMRSGEVTADEVGRVLATHMELTPLNSVYPVRTFDRTDIAWVARILWVSQ